MLVKVNGSSSLQNLQFTRNIGFCTPLAGLCCGSVFTKDLIRDGAMGSSGSCSGDFGGFSLLVWETNRGVL